MTGDKFEHERMIGEQNQLVPYLQRSSWTLAAAGVLLLLSGTFANEGGPALTWMSGVGLVLLLLAVFCHRYARKVANRR